MTIDRRNVLVCAILLAIAAAVTWPAVEMGINDEWSYARTAFEFARSGHIVYNGWSSPILIPQILWSALFVKLFGSSFLALRLSSIMIGIGCIPAMYFLARECGLNPDFATFATLLSVVAPVFLPEVVTYMTDAHGFLPFVLCLYAGVRASKAKAATEFAGCCAAIAITGLWAGLVRQVFFAAPVLFLLTLAWIKRRQIRILWPITGSIATLAIALTILHWYSGQPYAIPDTTAADVLQQSLGDVLHDSSITLLRYLGNLPLFLLPLLAAFFVASFKIVEPKLWMPAFTLTAILTSILVRDPERRPPWLGNVVTNDGIFSPSAVALGARPATITPPIQILLFFAVLTGVAAVLLVLWKLRRTKPPAEKPLDDNSIRAFLALGVPFAVIALVLIAVRSYFISVFDRYLIPIVPICSIPLLWFYQSRVRDRMNLAGWSVLAFCSLYAVAGTHDLFADYRARLQAIQAVEARGVPRKEILGGLEYDGWTQTDITGYVNHWDLPVDVRRLITSCSGNLPASYIWYREMTPDLTPRYFLTFSPLRELVDSPFEPVNYSSWLPPRRRTIWIQMLPDRSKSVCH